MERRASAGSLQFALRCASTTRREPAVRDAAYEFGGFGVAQMPVRARDPVCHRARIGARPQQHVIVIRLDDRARRRRPVPDGRRPSLGPGHMRLRFGTRSASRSRRSQPAPPHREGRGSCVRPWCSGPRLRLPAPTRHPPAASPIFVGTPCRASRTSRHPNNLLPAIAARAWSECSCVNTTSLDLLRCQADAGETPHERPDRQPGVHQHVRAIGLQQHGIPVTASSEHPASHRVRFGPPSLQPIRSRAPALVHALR